MRTNIYIVALSALLFASCSKDVMNRINENDHNPKDVLSKFILTDVMTSSAFNITGSDYAFYASVYMELNSGAVAEMYNAEIRNGQPSSSTTYNNMWVNQYANLYSLKKVIQKCSPGGSESGNYTNLGIAQILTAYNLAMLTDLMGDVPYTEALQPETILQPKLDKQERIYDSVFKLLDNAIVNLSKSSSSSIGKQDLIYGGDQSKWIKAAYGLKARYAMRLSFRKPDYQNVIDNANNAFANADEEFKFKYDGISSENPFVAFVRDNQYLGVSQSLYYKLSVKSDPRSYVFFSPAMLVPTAPTYLQSYRELEFLKAEAYARLNDMPNALASLYKAVCASFEKVGMSAYAYMYFAGVVQPSFNANPLNEIMNQKYFACYPDESIEAYNDYRRLKAMGNNFIILANPLNATKFPLRYAYGSSDVTANKNIKAAYGNGNYVYTENVWWAGGNR